ncbi:zinc finger protein 891 isoform X3 [Dendroctonus ponderosae]|uniref:zinc finger protein 891 isoform X3 n=1 Tax=Dendroctonus ponderosae TaxID=77166 RepID=UPI0020359B82|nr:zinc finger protein 891 isoform X3 [Dendroctonus ponderosae]
MNLENVCRTCLRVPQNPKMLFEDKTELVKKIEALSAVVIEETEELPKHICEECVQNINNYYNFRKVIINTDLDLRTRLNTLKATKYTFKPRSKMKHCEIVTDFFEDSVDIKPEEDMEFAEDDIKIVDHDLEKSIDANDSEYMPKQDLDMLKDLATKRIFKCRQYPDFRKVACSLCGKKVHELKKHMLTHTGQRPYSCENCQKGFTSRYALKIHKRQHTNERPYICNHCGNGFPQKVSLLTHLKSKHCIVI